MKKLNEYSPSYNVIHLTHNKAYSNNNIYSILNNSYDNSSFNYNIKKDLNTVSHTPKCQKIKNFLKDCSEISKIIYNKTDANLITFRSKNNNINNDKINFNLKQKNNFFISNNNSNNYNNLNISRNKSAIFKQIKARPISQIAKTYSNLNKKMSLLQKINYIRNENKRLKSDINSYNELIEEYKEIFRDSVKSIQNLFIEYNKLKYRSKINKKNDLLNEVNKLKQKIQIIEQKYNLKLIEKENIIKILEKEVNLLFDEKKQIFNKYKNLENIRNKTKSELLNTIEILENKRNIVLKNSKKYY